MFLLGWLFALWRKWDRPAGICDGCMDARDTCDHRWLPLHWMMFVKCDSISWGIHTKEISQLRRSLQYKRQLNARIPVLQGGIVAWGVMVRRECQYRTVSWWLPVLGTCYRWWNVLTAMVPLVARGGGDGGRGRLHFWHQKGELALFSWFFRLKSLIYEFPCSYRYVVTWWGDLNNSVI